MSRQKLDESVSFWHFCALAGLQYQSCADLGGLENQGGTLELPTNFRLAENFEFRWGILT